MAFTQVDRWVGAIATVQALVVAPTGKITAVSAWWTGQANWVPVPASGIPVGAEFSLAVDWANNSPYAVRGQVVATLITPSGQRVSLNMGTAYAQSVSGRVTLSEAGAYSLEASLSLEPA